MKTMGKEREREALGKFNHKRLDRLIHSGVRLSLLTILAKEKEANFNYLKKLTGTSDGNLSLNLRKLVDARYVDEKKTFANRRPLSTYRMTELGRCKYVEHLEHIKSLVFDTS